MEQTKYSAVIKWSLVIGIVVLVNMFLNYAVSLVYESPKYENFCPQRQVVDNIGTKDSCVALGGQWNENYYKSPDIKQAEPTGYCDPDFTCRKEFEDVSSVYNRNIFIILVAAGVLLLASSFALAFNWILSVSFSMAGILSIIIASMRYWSDADNLLRVIILFLALLALIYFAVKKFKN